MGKAKVTFTVHSPKKTWKVQDAKMLNEIFMNEINDNAVSVAVTQLYTDAQLRKIDTILMYATFFQRVVARTPLDEKYVNYKTENGKRVYHIPDTNRCKLDWYIESDGKKITSEELMLMDFKFTQIDNKEEIDRLVDIFDKFLTFSKRGVIHATIGNTNEHFTVLEYGGGYGWGTDTTPRKGIKEKWFDNGYEHGVKNEHSVQAPVGMLRVTEAEMLKETRGAKKRNEYTIGHKRGMRRDFSKADLKSMKKILEKRNLNFEDIERYMKNYK